jgi:hypothetical protein
MQFVTIQKEKPTYIISGCSDVIHLGGICGLYTTDLETYKKRRQEGKIPIVDWSIDCLPTSGLLRLFCSKRIIVGASLSSFEIFCK